MPSLLHETLRDLLRQRVELIPQLLRDALGVSLPDYRELRVESAELTQTTPTEYRADLALTLRSERALVGLIVEPQLGVKARKRLVWPAYLASYRAALGCDCLLVVVTPSGAWPSGRVDLSTWDQGAW